MDKILIADDNSNVQKTVVLALADMNVNVFAVNNGEAAVRKMADFHPDLVLADIFMPVRSGYEVCEYVKKDVRFAHVPVVLLAGAFDPVDEHEAQRVGADGILKKPFVPPVPLITMVKALLERRTSQQVIEAKKTEVPVEAPEIVSPEPEPAESEVDEFSRFLGADNLQAAAAGENKVETEFEADDQELVTNQRSAALGEPIFWRNDSDDSEVETNTESAVDTDSFELIREEQGETAPSVVNPEPILLDQAAQAQPESAVDTESLELIREEWGETAPSVANPEPILLDQAAQAQPESAVDTESLELIREEWGETAPSVANPEPILLDQAAQAQPESAVDTEPLELIREEWDETAASVVNPEPILLDQAAQAQLTVDAGKAEELESNSASMVAPLESTPHQDEPMVLVDTSDTIDPPAKLEPIEEPAAPANDGDALDSTFDITPAPAADPALELASADVPRAEQVPASDISASQSSVEAAHNPETADPVLPEPIEPDPLLVEAVVQRVLDKLRPQVVDIVTREFLKPIATALVRQEIESAFHKADAR